MRLKLFMLLWLAAALPALAQRATVTGVVIDSSTGAPIPGATVVVNDTQTAATTGPSGNFQLSNALSGEQIITISAPGYEPMGLQATLVDGQIVNMGDVKLLTSLPMDSFYENLTEMVFDENVLEDEEGTAQAINALTGSNDDIYYRTASYNFGPQYFNYRGYDSRYQDVYINGIRFNDPIRGRFNFSSLLGMTSRAFRNKTTTVGLGASAYGFGNIGGSTNYNTVTSTYSPGFYGNASYTNSAYMLRAMLTYSTGINSKGWGLTVSAIGRYAPQGIVPGTFYNSAGLFLSLEKELDLHNSLTLTAFGGPTQRAAGKATFQECYDLAHNNLYNPNWGYLGGKKRSCAIRESFDPTVILNWLYKKDRTTLNTAASVQWVHYNSTGFSYNGNSPMPDYYRYLPSYWASTLPEVAEELTEEWKYDLNGVRQINWDRLYEINYLNNTQNVGVAEADKLGANYILENRLSNQFNVLANSYLDQRLTDCLSLQAGASFRYTNASFYKTVRDLLGGEFWLDVDTYSDQISTLNSDIWQNNLDDPNRHVRKGDRFGYDYNIVAILGSAWIQNVINLPKWDINYGIEMNYTQYQREGHMRNGRAPLNSLGKSKVARFNDAKLKVGAMYKLDGHNYFQVHAQYGTQAPIADAIFVSPRVKNDLAPELNSEKVLAGDASYIWNYRRFRGSITGFWTVINDATEHTLFFDDTYSTNACFTLLGVKREYRGVELGMSYKITPSLTATFAGNYSRYQYRNNPKGVRSFENGMDEDVTRTVYLKNYYLGGATPQTACNLGIDWAAPKSWFLGINGTWTGDSYVTVGIPYHETFNDLWTQYPDPAQMEAKIDELTHQDKLKNAFTLNLSIGKLYYVSRSCSLNFNLNISNLLNNRNVVTYAYQQNRISTKEYQRDYYANRYTYAQGIRIFFNVGVHF